MQNKNGIPPHKGGRLIDRITEQANRRLGNPLTLVKKSKIKTWQALCFVLFAGGMAAAILGSVVLNIQTDSEAAEETVPFAACDYDNNGACNNADAVFEEECITANEDPSLYTTKNGVYDRADAICHLDCDGNHAYNFADIVCDNPEDAELVECDYDENGQCNNDDAIFFFDCQKTPLSQKGVINNADAICQVEIDDDGNMDGTYNFADLVFAKDFDGDDLPIGTFESINNTTCRVSGWTLDPDVPASAIQFRVYEGTSLLGSGTANLPKSNLAPFPNHGFSFNLPASLKDGRPHHISIYGMNAQGVSPDEESDRGELDNSPRTIQCIPPPATPANFTATPLSSSQIRVSWNQVANAVSYGLEHKKIPGNVGTGITVNGTTWTHTGLNPGDTYEYRVRASSASSVHSPWSPPVTTTTLPANRPPIGAHEGVVNSACRVTGWTLDQDTPSTSIKFQVYADRPAEPTAANFVGEGTANIFRSETNINGNHGFDYTLPATFANGQPLPKGAPHQIWIYGVDSQGGANRQLDLSPKTITCPAPAADTTKPTVPANFTATPTSSTSIRLTWTASTDNVGVKNYRLERCQGATCTNFVQVASPPGTSSNNAERTPNTTYRYRVRAVDAAGNLSGYSAIKNAKTLP